MSKPQHPYPLPVRVAVAETIAKQVLVMRGWTDLTQQTREAFLSDADEVLTAFWDASRVDDLDDLQDDAVYMTEYGGIGFVGQARDTNHCDLNQMAHILHWGKHHE